MVALEGLLIHPLKRTRGLSNGCSIPFCHRPALKGLCVTVPHAFLWFVGVATCSAPPPPFPRSFFPLICVALCCTCRTVFAPPRFPSPRANEDASGEDDDDDELCFGAFFSCSRKVTVFMGFQCGRQPQTCAQCKVVPCRPLSFCFPVTPAPPPPITGLSKRDDPVFPLFWAFFGTIAFRFQSNR